MAIYHNTNHVTRFKYSTQRQRGLDQAAPKGMRKTNPSTAHPVIPGIQIFPTFLMRFDLAPPHGTSPYGHVVPSCGTPVQNGYMPSPFFIEAALLKILLQKQTKRTKDVPTPHSQIQSKGIRNLK